MIVLDTNVASELMRTSPHAAVRGWIGAHKGQDLYTTAITIAEIHYGIERLPDGQRKELIRSTAEGLFSAFTDKILAFDAVAAAHYAGIVTRRDRAGLPIDGFDAQIAAICRARGAALATRNVKDFHDTGILVIDPWSDG
jgi:predicted nucleic acid-binding protein